MRAKQEDPHVNEPLTIRPIRASERIPGPAPVDEEARSTLHFIVVGGGSAGQLVRLSGGGTRIGRAVDNEVVWPDDGLSRHHAFLWADESGHVWLSDLGSTNGTSRNSEELQPRAPVRLHDGDRIRFGLSMVVKFARLTPSEEAFHRQLYERAARDPLTGLSNRASFLDQVGPLAERGALRGLDLAVILLDIDHFKQFNDTHGHEVGDLVLKKVAEALQQSTRPGDLVARYGGEEFVLAFLVPDASVGSQVAERVRQNIEDRRVELNGEALQVTASLGLVISHPATSRTFDQLIVSADECLYQAKRDGRNRVVREPGPSQGSTCDFRPA